MADIAMIAVFHTLSQVNQVDYSINFLHFSLKIAIVPLVPMDHRFDESYPFVYVGHVWVNTSVIFTRTQIHLFTG